MTAKLHEIFRNHNGKISDKWTLYISEFEDLFKEIRDKEINLFEIGVQNGGSLEIWAKYFTKANKIIGCDINKVCENLIFSDPRISVIIGDANSDSVEEQLSRSVSGLDIIIDDGSHNSSDIINSFSRYLKYLNYESFYIIEDLHASYWESYEGGLHNPFSAVAFFKRLVDLTNYEHWASLQSRTKFIQPYIDEWNLNIRDHDLCKIHSIAFINSLCIISIKPHEKNLLGDRIIVGSDGDVYPEIRNQTGMHLTEKQTDSNINNKFDVFSLVTEINKTNSKIEKQYETIKKLEDELNHTRQEFEKTLAKVNMEKLQIEEEGRENKKLITQLKTDLHNQRTKLEEMNDAIFEKEKIISQINKELTQKVYQLNKLKNELVEKTTTNKNLNNKLQELSKDTDFFKAYIFDMQQEILSYSTSKSWQITRPIRKISKIFKRGGNV
jgi:hypothetical protein